MRFVVLLAGVAGSTLLASRAGVVCFSLGIAAACLMAWLDTPHMRERRRRKLLGLRRRHDDVLEHAAPRRAHGPA